MEEKRLAKFGGLEKLRFGLEDAIVKCDTITVDEENSVVYLTGCSIKEKDNPNIEILTKTMDAEGIESFRIKRYHPKVIGEERKIKAFRQALPKRH